MENIIFLGKLYKIDLLSEVALYWNDRLKQSMFELSNIFARF